MGNSDDKIVMAWSDFGSCSPTCQFKGEEMWVLQKSDMTSGSTLRTANSLPDTTRFAIVPVRSLSTTTTQYLVYNNADGTNLVENQGSSTTERRTSTPNRGRSPLIRRLAEQHLVDCRK